MKFMTTQEKETKPLTEQCAFYRECALQEYVRRKQLEAENEKLNKSNEKLSKSNKELNDIIDTLNEIVKTMM